MNKTILDSSNIEFKLKVMELEALLTNMENAAEIAAEAEGANDAE